MTKKAKTTVAKETTDAPNRQLAIQRIYVKDISFEAPGAPDVFLGEWNPNNNIELASANRQLSETIYEVELTVSCDVKIAAEATDDKEPKTAFLVEVKQAGIFAIEGFEGDELGHILNAYCPNLLFPYVREVISDLVARGTFPQLVLQPINFEALYTQQLEQQADEQKH